MVLSGTMVIPGYVCITLSQRKILVLSFRSDTNRHYDQSLWCSTIAQRTYLLKHGPSAQTLALDSTAKYLGILNALTNSTYRIVMIFTCLSSSFVLRFIPYIGSLASFIFLCWVDA